jgi:hypothetical protein
VRISNRKKTTSKEYDELNIVYKILYLLRLIKKTNLKLPIEVRSVINRLFDAPGIKSNCKACIEFPVPVYSIPPQPS